MGCPYRTYISRVGTAHNSPEIHFRATFPGDGINFIDSESLIRYCNIHSSRIAFMKTNYAGHNSIYQKHPSIPKQKLKFCSGINSLKAKL